jgi:hypothetical protein
MKLDCPSHHNTTCLGKLGADESVPLIPFPATDVILCTHRSVLYGAGSLSATRSIFEPRIEFGDATCHS